jgi:gamma-glutamyltranspeptidase/glutathione hydrolase
MALAAHELSHSGLRASGFHTPQSLHRFAEVMRRAFAVRNSVLGDPDFVHIPTERLMSQAYADTLASTILADRATPSATITIASAASTESRQTTHFSIVDAQGGAAALTTTINGGFGAAVVVSGAGFLLNDEMDDFAAEPGKPNMFGLVQGEANAIAPGKRPLSSMTPTIVVKDGKLFMTAGAPGGSRISTAVLQVILNVIDFGMNVQDAIDAPRVHHQWQPDKLSLERGISPDTVALLKSRGYDVDYAPGVVLAQVAAIVSDGGWLQGGSDGRSAMGKAAGY